MYIQYRGLDYIYPVERSRLVYPVERSRLVYPVDRSKLGYPIERSYQLKNSNSLGRNKRRIN